MGGRRENSRNPNAKLASPRSMLMRLVSSVLCYSLTALIGGAVFYAFENDAEYQEALVNDAQLSAIKNMGEGPGGAVGSGALGGLPQECERPDDVPCARGVAAAAIGLFMPKLKMCKQGAPDIDALNWTPAGAFFYAFTIMTTIGYGTFAPATVGGKVATLIFGPIGIVVSGSTIFVVNQCVDQLLVWMISAACSRFGATYDPDRPRTKSLVLLMVSVLYLMLVAAISTAVSSRHFGNSLYFSFITLSTIGLGDYTFEMSTSRSMWAVWAQNMLLLPGLCIIGKVLENGSEFITKRHNAFWDTIEGRCGVPPRTATNFNGAYTDGLHGGSHASPPSMKKHPNPNAITPVTSEDSGVGDASPRIEDLAGASSATTPREGS